MQVKVQSSKYRALDRKGATSLIHFFIEGIESMVPGYLRTGIPRTPSFEEKNPEPNYMTIFIRSAGLGLILLSTAAQAQVPGGGFENWTNYDGYQDPTGWSSLNILTTALGGGLSCQQVPGSAGSYAAKVTTLDIEGFGAFAGLLITGAPEAASDGFPYVNRPNSLTGKWRGTLGAGDQAGVSIVLSRWNNTLQERESVGVGVAVLANSVANWTNFAAMIMYENAMTPDTASIVVISSLGEPMPGSTISVDELAFAGSSVGVDEMSSSGVQIYPIPSNDVLNISSNVALQELELWATDGRLMVRTNPRMDRAQLDLSGFASGTYLLRARMADGSTYQRMVVRN